MRIGSVTLPCGAQLVYEQDDWYGWGSYGPSASAAPVTCRLDRLRVTLAEAKALVNIGSGRYWGGMSVSHGLRSNGGMTISGIGITRDEAQAIRDGADPLTVLGVYPARVVLSIVRLPAD